MIQGHGGNIYAASLKYKIPKEKITDFSANINPLGLPSYIKNILFKNLGLATNYPDAECLNVKNAISKSSNIPRANIFIGNGSIEIIHLIPRLFKKPKALILGPTFSEYEKAIRLNNGAVKYLVAEEKADFRLNFRSINPYIRNTDIIFVCNPNNPTGTLLTKEEIKKIINNTSRETLVVIDEAFMDFVITPNNSSLINEAAKLKNVIVIRSFTKFFSMAGFRLGFAIGNKDLIDRLRTLQHLWSVNTLSQLIAPILVNDKKFIKRSINFIKNERDYLYKRLCGFNNIKAYKPTSNFIFCRIENKDMNSAKLEQALGKEGILIRDCSNFYGLNDRFIRIAVKKREDNLRLLQVLRWLSL